MEMGFDEALGMEEEKTVPEKPKRAPFAIWSIGGEDYRLKLKASTISALEQKYRRNLMVYLFDDGLPKISDMLTVVQAAMSQYHHGIKFQKVQDLYDEYVDAGGDQSKFMLEVLIPLLEVSGFFTSDQTEKLNEEIETNTKINL